MKKRIRLLFKLMSLFILCFSLFGCGNSSNTSSSLSNEVVMPLDSKKVKGKKYYEIEEDLKEAGFKNISNLIL